MKRLSTIYLLGALVTLGSCARQYPVFNQMPKNAYIQPKDQAQPVKPSMTENEVAVVAANEPKSVETRVSSEPETFAGLMANPQVAEMLANKSPKQIDEQLEMALATTQGQELMAKPVVAAQINKARKLIAQNELRNAPLSDVQTSKASKLVNSTLKKHMEKTALTPASTKEAKALNNKIRIGLILVLVGLLLYLIPGLGYAVGSVVAAVGVVFIVLGLIDNV